MLPILFSITLGLGAGLLFLVQPMIARMVLPQLGGTPAVWNTCMVFFQAALLAGYAYAHAVSTRLGTRRQLALHAVTLAAPLAFLPIAFSQEAARALSPTSDPALWLLGLLVATAGVPFFAVATTSPLLQRWFSGSGHPSADDPYFLYGASNLGSLTALLAYPILVEPYFGLATQARLWAVGYALLAILTLACALAAPPSPAALPSEAGGAGEAIELGRWLRWAGLAFIPSSLMLGVTTHLSTDIAPVPLLWMVPLAIYLLTFILVFAKRPPLRHGLMARLLPWSVVLLTLTMSLGGTQTPLILLHLLTFFLAAMACHGELAGRRPPARHLTAFYLAMSVGGVLGGAFNALVAPLLFDRVAEYPLAVVLACLVTPRPRPQAPRSPRRLLDLFLLPTAIGVFTLGMTAVMEGEAHNPTSGLRWRIIYGTASFACLALARRPVAFALAIGSILLVGGLSEGPHSKLEYRERSFYGVMKVVLANSGASRYFIHGSTYHGRQDTAPERRRLPLTYYSPDGPVGQIFEGLRADASVAIVGLGSGALACYAREGERWTFYEIDDAVARLARDSGRFTFLQDCRAGRPEIILGDARLRIREAPDRAYSLIVLDAFSSDAVPVHLLTREAFRIYRRKLAPGGRIAVHLSNRYLDLVPVIAVLARAEGMSCRVRDDERISPERQALGVFPTTWAAVAESDGGLGPLADDPRWFTPKANPAESPWTDDFSNLARHFKRP